MSTIPGGRLDLVDVTITAEQRERAAAFVRDRCPDDFADILDALGLS